MDMICVDVAIREILDPIKQEAHSRKAAQSYIDSFRIEKTGFIKIDLVNDHRYAQWLEYGTEPHTIDSPVLINHEWKYIGVHPGFEGYNILDDVLQEYAQNYATIVSRETSDYLERSKMR